MYDADMSISAVFSSSVFAAIRKSQIVHNKQLSEITKHVVGLLSCAADGAGVHVAHTFFLPEISTRWVRRVDKKEMGMRQSMEVPTVPNRDVCYTEQNGDMDVLGTQQILM